MFWPMAFCLTDGYPTLNLESIMNYQLRNYLVEQVLSLGLQNKVIEHSDSCFYLFIVFNHHATADDLHAI